jgi:hypothetical protein
MKHLVVFCALFLSVCSFFSSSLSAQGSTGKRPELIFYRHNSNSFGATPAVQGDTVGSILFRGLTQSPNVVSMGASIRSVIAGPVSAGVLPSNLIFATSSVGAPNNRMIITETGLVGIGTMTPGYHLEVQGNTHTTGDFFGRIHFDKNIGSDDSPMSYIDEAYFELKTRSVLGLPAGPGTYGGVLSLAPGLSSHDHQLFFGEDGVFHRRAAGNAGSWAGATWYKFLTGEDINGTVNYVSKFTAPNRLGDSQLFDNGTNVGIGTNTPAAKLDVNGTFRSAGNATVGSNLTVSGDATVNNFLTVQNSATFNNSATVAGPLTANGGSLLNGGTAVSPNGAGVALDVFGTTRIGGRVAIGPSGSTPALANGYALSVEGRIITDEVQVQLRADWPDYVFADGYQLPDLCETEQFIQTHKHLPGIPSAAEVQANGGIELGEMNRLMMQKIEEMTLLLIDQQKQIDALKTQLGQR